MAVYEFIFNATFLLQNNSSTTSSCCAGAPRNAEIHCPTSHGQMDERLSSTFCNNRHSPAELARQRPQICQRRPPFWTRLPITQAKPLRGATHDNCAELNTRTCRTWEAGDATLQNLALYHVHRHTHTHTLQQGGP